MSMRTTLPTQQILWLTDLHLDHAALDRKQTLYSEIARSTADTILITGDISSSKQLPLHLRELAAAASWRQVHFVLGNHDFFASSMAAVDGVVAGICRSHVNLRHLGQGEIIRLNPDTALVGHRGWGDGRMGWGSRTFASNPDFSAITDFASLSRQEAFALLRRLGQDSAAYMRGIIPYALTCYRHVIVATHVPPITFAARFNGKSCDWLRQPFYVNIALGSFLLRIAKFFPQKRITVLSGHTHHAAHFRATPPNIEFMVGGAKPGFPRTQRLFELSAQGLVTKRAP